MLTFVCLKNRGHLKLFVNPIMFFAWIIFAVLLAAIPEAVWEFETNSAAFVVGCLFALVGMAASVKMWVKNEDDWWVPSIICLPLILLAWLWSLMATSLLLILLFWGLTAALVAVFIWLLMMKTEQDGFASAFFTAALGYDVLLFFAFFGSTLSKGWDKIIMLIQ